MGGSNSRQLSKRDSKQRREQRVQQKGKQEISPTEHSENVTFSLESNDDRLKAVYRSNQEDFNVSRDNSHEQQCGIMHSDANPLLFDGPKRFYSENKNNAVQPSSNNKPCFETDFSGEVGNFFPEKPYSTNYEARQFQRPLQWYDSFHDTHKQVDRNSLQNYSRLDFMMVDSKEKKSNSCDEDSDDVVLWGNVNSSDACEESLAFDSPGECVKQRQSDDSQSFCFLSNDRSENERSHSSLSHCSNTTDNSAESEGASNEIPHALNILSFPSVWSSCTEGTIGYVNISPSSTEGNSVQRFFQRTCKSKDFYLFISGIVRIENPFLHTLYLLKKEEMAMRNGHVDELFLFHGTKKNLVSKICENNLDWRLYSKMHRFGKGVSFSSSATYSSHYSDDKDSDKVLLLFKVLTSNCVLGSEDMDIPPSHDEVSFDTSIKEDVSVIVKYNDNEFYPLYKIIYKKLFRTLN